MRFIIAVRVGRHAYASTARRRYSEFLRLKNSLHARFPELAEGKQAACFPPFPPKELPWRGTQPAVVTRRTVGLNRWLQGVCAAIQYVDDELLRFLEIPLYLALRVMSGDFDDQEYAQHRAAACAFPSGPGCARNLLSPDSVLSSGWLVEAVDSPGSPQAQVADLTDHASLARRDSLLKASALRPGYEEALRLVARAIGAHARAAALPSPPSATEATRWTNTVCQRGLFKSPSLVCCAVYMRRLEASAEFHALLLSQGWRLTLLALLLISAKQWDSDYPTSTADLCAPNTLPPAPPGSASPPLSPRRVALLVAGGSTDLPQT
jgi:hypothetical protein